MTKYLNTLSPLSESLQTVWDRGEARKHGLQIEPYEARFLQFLVRSTQAKQILELGCFYGLSALAMAEAAEEDAQILTCERHAETATVARENINSHPHGNKVTLFEGDAFDAIAAGEGPFDLAFVDAEKKSYCAYIEALHPNMRKGGVIAIDNTLRRGAIETGIPEKGVSKASIDAIREMHALLQDRSKFEAVTLPTSDGITLAVVL